MSSGQAMCSFRRNPAPVSPNKHLCMNRNDTHNNCSQKYFHIRNSGVFGLSKWYTSDAVNQFEHECVVVSMSALIAFEGWKGLCSLFAWDRKKFLRRLD